MFQLILGTTNLKKLGEINSMLPRGMIEWSTLADHEHAIDVVEDGNSFAENAAKKAVQQAKHLHHWVLAEDSGLSVDALDGRPGIYSARFAGPEQDDDANLEKLLAELKDVPAQKRDAHYTSSLCLSDPDGQVRLTAEDTCGGRILSSRQGTGGFGYDPIFQIREYHRTFGELDPVTKRAISHRSRALRRFVPELIRLIKSIESGGTTPNGDQSSASALGQ